MICTPNILYIKENISYVQLYLDSPVTETTTIKQNTHKKIKKVILLNLLFV